MLWAEWGCHLEGSAVELICVPTDHLRHSDVFSVLKVHSIVVVVFPSFISRVAGVRIGVGVTVVILAHLLCGGG